MVKAASLVNLVNKSVEGGSALFFGSFCVSVTVLFPLLDHSSIQRCFRPHAVVCLFILLKIAHFAPEV